MATLRGSAERFQTSEPKRGEGVGDALNAETIGGASEGAFNTAALFCTGSRMLIVSVISEAPNTKPFAFTLALRVSEAALSDRPSFGVGLGHAERWPIRQRRLRYAQCEGECERLSVRSLGNDGHDQHSGPGTKQGRCVEGSFRSPSNGLSVQCIPYTLASFRFRGLEAFGRSAQRSH